MWCAVLSCSVMSNSATPRTVARLLCPCNSPNKKIGVSWYSLLQGIFQIQGSNRSIPHCRQILYHLSHQVGLKAAYLFPLSGWSRDRFRPSVTLKHHRLKLTSGRAVPPGSLAPKAVLAPLLYCKCSKGRLPEPLICNYSGVSRDSPALLPPIHSQSRRLSPILYSRGGR